MDENGLSIESVNYDWSMQVQKLVLAKLLLIA